MQKILLKNQEDIQTTSIEVTRSPSEVVDEEHLFFTQADNGNDSKEQIFQRKGQSWQNAKDCVAVEEPLSLKISVVEFTKIDRTTTSYSLERIKANARVRVKQDVDKVFQILELKILGQPHGEVLLTTERLFKHYEANESRILLKEEILFQKYFGETGSFKHY